MHTSRAVRLSVVISNFPVKLRFIRSHVVQQLNRRYVEVHYLRPFVAK
jgi:hypothetical protein